MADDTLWWEEEHEVEDTERCACCQCYFVWEDLIVGYDGPAMCLDCLNGNLQAEEWSGPEILALEDQRDDK